MRPVCVKCKKEMRVEKNDVGILLVIPTGPYQLWSADMHKCPNCHEMFISGYGAVPVAGNWNKERLAEEVEWYKKTSILIEVPTR